MAKDRVKRLHIDLKIAPEVSEIDPNNTLVVNDIDALTPAEQAES